MARDSVYVLPSSQVAGWVYSVTNARQHCLDRPALSIVVHLCGAKIAEYALRSARVILGERCHCGPILGGQSLSVSGQSFTDGSLDGLLISQ